MEPSVHRVTPTARNDHRRARPRRDGDGRAFRERLAGSEGEPEEPTHTAPEPPAAESPPTPGDDEPGRHLDVTA